jgi:hypothetical protein
MYRLTVGYLHHVFDYIPMYQIMYLTLNQVNLYASLIFAGTTKPAITTAPKSNSGMSENISRERPKRLTYSLLEIYMLRKMV